jgi:hypothetical protein
MDGEILQSVGLRNSCHRYVGWFNGQTCLIWEQPRHFWAVLARHREQKVPSSHAFEFFAIYMHRKTTESNCLLEDDLMISAAFVVHPRMHRMTYQIPFRSLYYSAMLSAASYHSHHPFIRCCRPLLLTTPRIPATYYSVARITRFGASPCTVPWPVILRQNRSYKLSVL